MKIGAHILNLALAGALGFVSVPLHAAEPWSSAKMTPLHAVSLNQGEKRVVAYFVEQDGVCNLAVTIGDLPNDGDDVPTTKIFRVVVDIASGRSARVDSPMAKTLSFSCEDEARSMSFTELDRVALESRF